MDTILANSMKVACGLILISFGTYFYGAEICKLLFGEIKKQSMVRAGRPSAWDSENQCKSGATKSERFSHNK